MIWNHAYLHNYPTRKFKKAGEIYTSYNFIVSDLAYMSLHEGDDINTAYRD